jgi:hypothetical protein
MRRAGRFLWLDWAHAAGRLSASPDSACADRFEGKHDGYSRFGVTHHRTVQWLSDAGWVIVDDVEGSAEHDVRLHWLAADLPYEVFHSPFEVVFRAGQSRIRWGIFAGVPGCAAVIRAGKQADSMKEKNSKHGMGIADIPLLGWESPTYGELRPAVSLIYETRSRLPVRLVTGVLTEERCSFQSRGNEIVILRDGAHRDSSEESEIYRVSLSANQPHSAGTLRSSASVPTS